MTLPHRARSTVRGVGTAPIEKQYTVSACAVVAAAGLSGCDPVLNIAGAHFPAWLVCALAGALGAALTRPLFLALRLEAYLWPRPLVYSSLAVLLACIMYLLCFNRI
jgi:YtcA-like protein